MKILVVGLDCAVPELLLGDDSAAQMTIQHVDLFLIRLSSG
jgi:hypothetical protein